MAYERIFVTGGAGFIGSAFVRAALDAAPSRQVTSFDLLTYAGHRENLDDVDADRHTLVVGDVVDPVAVDAALDAFAPDAVVHLAAETHVDRSLADPARFLRTNIEGTRVLLAACRARGIRMLLVSTDEVYGDLAAPTVATPDSPLRPSNVYAVSKAAADMLALVAHRTDGQDVVVTRGTNTYGPRQIPEKLIPLMTTRAMAGATLPVYGDGTQQRDWLHVDDHARGILTALERAPAGSIQHLAGGDVRTNLDIVERILASVGVEGARIEHVADRPGHDRRYALDDQETRTRLGWRPTTGFEQGFAATLAWYADNRAWSRAVAGPDLAAFLEANYSARG